MVTSEKMNNPDYPGYTLLERRFVKEINADCLLLQHISSGARIFKVAADDDNKTFSIAFNTLPESDAGTPHILEHSVLNGSKNFPVKSPFDILTKGSLNTFLNAMTFDDFTIYPVASMNEKDYFNLMHVYLDAVFFPAIYDDPRIFMQEGWHIELSGKDDPMEYKGVVYNEMKGAFSNAERELWYRIQQQLFPDNAYAFSSGGYPEAIPSLTYETFLAFHKKNYHPSNAYIFLYGNADPAKELAFIDEKYLSHFIRQEYNQEIMPHKGFDKVREAESYYPVTEGAPLQNQTYLSMNWVTGIGSDTLTSVLLDVLSDVLVNHESAPIRKAFQKLGIGKDVYANVQYMRQNTFSIVVQNADLSDKEKFREVIYQTLHEVAEKGIDRDTIKGAINRLEFRLREGNDAQKGLTCNLRCIYSWLYANDPFTPLEYEKHLAALKQAVSEGLPESFIRHNLIDNSYGLLLTLQPKEGLEKETTRKIENELAAIRQAMTENEIDHLIQSTSDLIAFQKREDHAEAIAAMPSLQLADIKKEAEWYTPINMNLKGIPHLHFNTCTIGILYMNFWFNLKVLPQEKIPFVSLLVQLLGKLDTTHYSFEKLDQALNIYTGGFSTSVNIHLPEYNDDAFEPRMKIHMKITPDHIEKAFELLKEIIAGTRFSDHKRVHDLIKRHHSHTEAWTRQNGYGVAVTRLESYYLKRGVFAENSRGLTYFGFLTELLNKFDKEPEAVVDELQQTAAMIFSADNLIAGITASEEDFRKYTGFCQPLFEAIPPKKQTIHSWNLFPEVKNEGILSASVVQYVIQGYDFKKTGWQWNGKWYVLNQVLSTDWLQNRVRVIGGAYGGFANISRNGSVYLSSYRDPNLEETFDVFAKTANYLSEFEADPDMMTRYIIGTIANIDYPLTPSEKGEQAFKWYFEKVTAEQLQMDRDAVLSVTSSDIKEMAGFIRAIMDNRVYCVYGNLSKLTESKHLFHRLIPIHP